MAVQFWEEQRKRRLYTTLYMGVFIVLAVAVSWVVDMIARYFAAEGYTSNIPHVGIYMFIFIVLVSFFYYVSYAGFGGSSVAESMGGIRVTQGDDVPPKVQQLLNIVEELSIASRQPMPAVYLIKANEINAFAAGLKPEKACIAVTTGALEQLNREELQGVIAHEFGHIATGDMKIGMRLAALLMGFFLVFYIGLRMMEGSMFARDRNGKGGSIALIALLVLLGGLLLWFAGSILRACVSREREYNADAKAVEFTRTPFGIASALKKIQAVNVVAKDMPKSGIGYKHLYLDNRSFFLRLFATHPPLEKRIAILEGRKL